jgi:hypothetical protein
MIKLDCSNIRKKLTPQPKEKIDKMKAIFLRFLIQRLNGVAEWLEEHIKLIKSPP